MKPDHFKKVIYPISCENCKYLKRNWKQHTSTCSRHVFEVSKTLNSRTLAETTCDNAIEFEDNDQNN